MQITCIQLYGFKHSYLIQIIFELISLTIDEFVFLSHINHCRLFNTEYIFRHKTVLLQSIHFNIRAQYSHFRPIDRNLYGATTPGWREPRSYGNKGVLHISQSSSITGALPSDCLLSYPAYLFGESCPQPRYTVGVYYSLSQPNR